MSDHLLRLARALLDKELYELRDDCTSHLSRELTEIVRDLEAAGSDAPARRTITREEFNDTLLSMHDYVCSSDADKLRRIAAAWRLTVED